MDTYLSKRKKPTTKKKPVKEEPKEKVVEQEFKEEEKEYYKKDKNMIDKFLDFILGEEKHEPDVKEIEEIEEEIDEEIKEEKEFESELEEIEEEPKTGFFEKIKKLLFYNKAQEELVYEEIEVEKDIEAINEDIKEALKIQNKWLKKLSPKEIKKFKESDDYVRYVEILEKHNLIKKD